MNVVFKSFLIEDGIMEIPFYHIISMKVIRHALTNDILKFRGDFYSCYHLGATIFYVFLEWIEGWSLEGNEWKVWGIFTIQTFFASPHGKDVPCLGWKSLTLSLVLINQWNMQKTNQGMHVQITSWVFDANMDNHGAIQSIMDGLIVWVQLLTPLILLVCDTKIIHQIFMFFFCGHIGQWKGHMWCQGLCISYASRIWWVLQF